MKEFKLDFDTLEDVFRHGRKVTTIVQDYQNYSISLGYRWDENKKQLCDYQCQTLQERGEEKEMRRFASLAPLRKTL